MTFPFIPLSLLVVGAGSAGYLIWDTFRIETPKEKYERLEREVSTDCGKNPRNSDNKLNEKNMDWVTWRNCVEKFIKEFFPSIPLDRYGANTDKEVLKDERERQIENICGKNAEVRDIDCWSTIREFIMALESWDANVHEDSSQPSSKTLTKDEKVLEECGSDIWSDRETKFIFNEKAKDLEEWGRCYADITQFYEAYYENNSKNQ